MTRMLASVTGVEEALLVANGGADLIDLKDPASGALGALPEGTLRAVRRALPRHPVSATIGDLPLEPGTVREAVIRTAACGVDYVKVGLFPGGDLEATLDGLRPLAQTTPLIAVLMADHLIALSLVDRVAQSGFRGVMLDTADKGKGPLTEIRPPSFLERFVERGKSRGLLTGLAGSLRLRDIDVLLPLQPDYLGFRSALCRGGRQQGIDPRLLMAIRHRIPVPSRS